MRVGCGERSPRHDGVELPQHLAQLLGERHQPVALFGCDRDLLGKAFHFSHLTIKDILS
jgi:UDP-N-acetyl-D-mannosaminuronic acid transferase (WecB/TagA/CpsF family)